MASETDLLNRTPADSAGKRYRLEGEIGRGGMGAVYRAHDTLLDREVAVKMLTDPGLGTQGRARLLREAQSAARLNHPNVVAVFDAGEWDGAPFIVMELVDGEPLASLGSQDLATVLELASQVCAALAHAHAHGVIHRDLKPENVLVTPGGQAKLMDFGLARSAEASPLTVAGAIVGTVNYLAPESALGQAIDARADLYSFGVMLYQQASGRLPFEGGDLLAVITQHLHAPVIPPSTFNPAIPPALDALLLRLLSKDPQDRPASAAEVLEAIREIQPDLGIADQPTPGRLDLPLIQRLGRGRLVGRERELSEGRAVWERVAGDEGQAFLISGEPGVGKTRFAEELIAYARLRGARVLRGGCYEYEAATPYLPLAEALRDWVHGQTDETLRALPVQTAAELARLAPELEVRLGPLPPGPPLTPDQERLRLFDHLARFLGELAGKSGLLLFIDDLHWSDRGTLSCLQYLLRRLRGERLLVLGAYREVELDRAHPLAAALVDWNRERLATRLHLGRLSLEDCALLLAVLFGQEDVTPEFVEAIYLETDGNPFFVEEVIKALVEQGQIYRQDGAWERRAVEELAIPQSIKEAIGRRLDRLDPATVETLQQAAVLGKTFAFAELAAADPSPGGEGGLLDALDQALAAQLLRAGPGESFAFTHDKIREVLYEELNPIRRRRYHQRLADGLERLYPGEALEAHVQDLAYHTLQSGDLGRALEYSLHAAQKARQLYAIDDALLYYQYALECAASLGLQARLIELHNAIGEMQGASGLAYQAVESFQRALELAKDQEARAALKTKIGAAYTVVGDLRGLDYLQTAEHELDPERQVGELALNLTMQGRFHHYRAEHTASIEYLQRARSLSESLDEPYALAEIYSHLAGAYQHLAQLDESLHWAQKCIEFGERTGDPTAIAYGTEFLAEGYSILGKWRMALEYAERDRQIGEKYGFQDRIAWSALPRSFGLAGLGQLSAARDAAREGAAIAKQIGEHRLEVWLGASQGLVEADLGNVEQAVSLASHALEEAERLEQIAVSSFARLSLVRALVAKGELNQALEMSKYGIETVEHSENRIARLYVGLARITALAEAGDPSQVLAVVEDYLALTRSAGTQHWEGIALRCQGQAYLELGQEPAAAGALEAAIRRFEELGSQLELGRALNQRARLDFAQGESQAARQNAARALAIFEGCEAAREVAEARRFMRSQGEGG